MILLDLLANIAVGKTPLISNVMGLNVILSTGLAVFNG